MRNISNSEVISWLSCRLQYDFAFMQNLTPKETPTPLSRGTLGHEAFQRYVETRLEGFNHSQALNAPKQVFLNAMKELTPDVVLETKFLFDRYMEHHKGWPEWTLLGAEQRHDLPITEELAIPMRYDILVKENRTNKILVGDFKFTYEFWQPYEHDLNPQLPKYIQILNNNGIEVHGGFLEEIRTRPLGKDKSNDPKNLWRRTHYYPSIARKRNLLRQHVAASIEIEQYRSLSREDQLATAQPVLSKHGACKYCNFKDLCASKLDGGDLTVAIQLDYTQNTYGYNNNNDSLGELL